MSMSIKKNDTVKVITGDDKGVVGKVLRVFPAENKLVVEGVAIAKKHQKPSQENPQGGIVEKPMAIQASNVMLVDPKTGAPTRVRRQREEGKPSVRVTKRSNTVID
jgi:large subunit ribosomal protein L24